MLKICLAKLHSLCYFMITDYIYICVCVFNESISVLINIFTLLPSASWALSYIYAYIYIYICIYVYICIYIIYVHIYTYILYIYLYTQQNFMAPFCWWGATASRLYRATMRLQLTFYQKFLVLIRSILEGWKAETTLKPSSGFKLLYQPSYYQI